MKEKYQQSEPPPPQACATVHTRAPSPLRRLCNFHCAYASAGLSLAHVHSLQLTPTLGRLQQLSPAHCTDWRTNNKEVGVSSGPLCVLMVHLVPCNKRSILTQLGLVDGSINEQAKKLQHCGPLVLHCRRPYNLGHEVLASGQACSRQL